MNFKLTGYGVKKTIAIFAYKQLGLSMDIETKVVQYVSSPKESNLTTWQPDNLKPYTRAHLFHLWKHCFPCYFQRSFLYFRLYFLHFRHYILLLYFRLSILFHLRRSFLLYFLRPLLCCFQLSISHFQRSMKFNYGLKSFMCVLILI